MGYVFAIILSEVFIELSNAPIRIERALLLRMGV